MKKYLVVTLLAVFMMVSSIAYAQPPPPPPTPGGPGGNDSDETCSDQIKNQGETDIDCGWPCDACGEGKSCFADTDCLTDYCNPDDICSYLSCDDGWKNGNETDVDCGGNCSACSGNGQNNNGGNGGGGGNGGSDQNDGNQDQDEETEDTGQQAFTGPDEPAGETAPGAEADTGDDDSGSDLKEKEKGSFLLIFSLFLNFILIGFLATVLVLFYRGKGTSGFQEKNIGIKNQSPTGETAMLSNYIKSGLSRGYNSDLIRRSLLQRGWPSEKVDKAFREMRKW